MTRLYVSKSTDTTRNFIANPTADPHLAWSSLAAGLYAIDGELQVGSTTTGTIQFAMIPSVNPSISSTVSFIRAVASGSSYGKQIAITSPLTKNNLDVTGVSSAATATRFIVTGLIHVPSTMDLSMAWASFSATDNIMRAGSWMSLDGPL